MQIRKQLHPHECAFRLDNTLELGIQYCYRFVPDIKNNIRKKTNASIIITPGDLNRNVQTSFFIQWIWEISRMQINHNTTACFNYITVDLDNLSSSIYFTGRILAYVQVLIIWSRFYGARSSPEIRFLNKKK